MLTEEQKKALDAPLDQRHVRPPPQGKFGEYVEGVHVLYEANRIFDFDGWSSEVQEARLTNEEHDNGKHRVGYMVIVNVTAGGQRRCGIGHGQGFGKSLGDAHDSAVKEAETDAIKRALRTFGNPFGLALYDKTKANVQAAVITDDQRTELMQLLDHLNVPVGEVLEVGKIADLRDLEADRFDGLKSWINKRAIELRNEKDDA